MRRPIIVLVVLAAALPAATREFRSVHPIRHPVKGAPAAIAPAHPVDEKVVEAKLRALLDAWNTPRLGALMSDRFYDGIRLTDTLATIPRDARVRLLSVQAIRVTRQDARAAGPGASELRVVSGVSVIARTQVEYEDAVEGFQRLEGVNEYVFEVTEVIPG